MKNVVSLLAIPLGLLVLSVMTGCHQPSLSWTFADFPGFREYRCLPTANAQPDGAARSLLHRFRPRLVVAPGAAWPIDFYRDYLPNAVLRDADEAGKIVATQVTREVLQRAAEHPRLYLDVQYTPNVRREGKPQPCMGGSTTNQSH